MDLCTRASKKQSSNLSSSESEFAKCKVNENSLLDSTTLHLLSLIHHSAVPLMVLTAKSSSVCILKIKMDITEKHTQ